ncbi:PREDICTED: stress response protein NST1-like [Nicrophorus vespilloides]|uniref:Stress response protein NST1-like n=1 Tax=Nicrophorus vespilloides TaxID=110193 RepID=A0ABM1M5F6_NICVS|nr:PREDICTED: stress response protein NST1-like [Nicrophorus vespilloides]
MSVCDVPLCTSVSIGVSNGAMSASKGVSRSSNVNETRDRLRIRLHQRKLHASTAQKSIEKYPFNPDITYSVQSGPLAKPKTEKAENLQPKVVKTSTNTPLLLEDNLKITKMMKNLDICMPKVKTTTKKGETKEQTVDTKVQKDKENNSNIQQVATAPPASNQQHNIYKTDIDELIKFIEGKDYEIAQKKAAKKARQKEKKDEENRKRKAEEDRKRKAELLRLLEEKRKEEERLKAEQAAKDAAIKKANKKKLQQQLKQQQQQQAKKHESKTKKKKKSVPVAPPEPELLEETIPAMVTIKRIVENNNCPPTVTITLKGSTPDQDKLLYTLVNGHNNRNAEKTVEPPVPKKDESKTASSKKKKKKKKKEAEKAKTMLQTKSTEKEETVTMSEMKVTLSVDRSFRKELEAKGIHKVETTKRTIIQEVPKLSCDKSKMRETLIDIPSLKLPPGITITKVNGPLAARKTPNVQSTAEYNGVPVSKSGVIVVDTEKLIQQSSGKKTKKKKKKSQEQQQQQMRQDNCNNRCNRRNEPIDEADMVTLKNPIFQKLQNKIVNKPPDAVPPIIDMNEQATISKGANGMVTIRRPRPMTLQNESPISDFLKPVIHSSGIETKSTLSDDRKIIRPPSPRATHATNHYDYELSRLSAQNILWGLPGIQITKVNKNGNFTEFTDHSEQAADVSIIRTGGFNLDKDDWPYDSVFTPKDILEDDLDAYERELEAFKRFCQQSVPPKRKEKVAHLHVNDIVLMKKEISSNTLLN